jgi:hypothetical protein
VLQNTFITTVNTDGSVDFEHMDGTSDLVVRDNPVRQLAE